MHLQANKVTGVLRSAYPNFFTPEVHDKLESIHRYCNVCQRESSKPRPFCVLIFRNESIFNRIITTDLINIDNLVIRHDVNNDTRFSATTIMKDEATKKYGTP